MKNRLRQFKLNYQILIQERKRVHKLYFYTKRPQLIRRLSLIKPARVLLPIIHEMVSEADVEIRLFHVTKNINPGPEYFYRLLVT